MPAKNAVSIYNDLRLAIALIQKEGLEAQKTIENFANKFKMQGITAGKEFASSIKNAFDNVEQSAVKLGKNIGKNFPEQIKLLSEGKKMIKDAWGAVKDFFKSDEGFGERIKTLKSSLEKSFSAATPEADSFTDIVKKITTITQQEIADGKELADNVKNAFEDVKQSAVNLGKSFDENITSQINLMQDGAETIKDVGEAFKYAFTSNEEFAEGITDRIISAKDTLKEIIPELSDIQLDNINISDETKENILAKFDEITEGITKAKKDVEGKSDNWLVNFLGLDEETLNDNIMKAEEIAGSVLSKISDLIRQHTEEQMAIIDMAL